MPPKKKKESIIINDPTLKRYNEIIIKLPDRMIVKNKKGDEIIKPALTNKNNIKKVNK